MEGILPDGAVRDFVLDQLASLPLDGRSVCLLVPDATRTCPLPLLLHAAQAALAGRVSHLTILVALGTHQSMSEAALRLHLDGGSRPLAQAFPDAVVLNHEWWKTETFAHLGTVSAARLRELSDGRMDTAVDVKLNRAVAEHDVSIVIGPVLPHEVVGMSGGNKYFFPGVAGQEIIDVSHWLGALITSAEIIGTTEITPVRELIDEASSMIPADTYAFCVVPGDGGLHSLSFGDCRSSWRDAAEVSAATHVTYLDAPVRRVLSVVPAMYADLWTGAKGFYKVEPVVADGGEVILYAPHITQLSVTHREILDIGYHCRDYFLAQWERFRDVHWGVLAHSTHLRGAGTYDAVTRRETSRINVTLASAIPEEVCRAVNVGYRDPQTLEVADYAADPETMLVPQAGEMLFRLR